MTSIRGYKVTTNDRSRICGIACRSFKELLIKGCSKLNLGDGKEVTVHLQDGTIIQSDSYFSTIPPQTLLVFSKNGEKIITGADLIYNALKLVNSDLIQAGDAINKFFDENLKAKVHVLSDLLKKTSEDDLDLVLASRKEEHLDWFIGIDSNAFTKEEYLEKRCRDRIRNFLYKSASEFRSSTPYKENVECREALEEVIKQLKQLLSKNRFCGVYFVRGCKEALCNTRGDFKCTGVWNTDKCFHNRGLGHEINPYRSRDHRIIFSTWNLDHRIERSRTILPTVTELLSKDSRCQINVTYLYELLFTTRNLRLVHVVCHDKSSHTTAKCDLKKMTCD